jgi:aryl carrier-like protein
MVKRELREKMFALIEAWQTSGLSQKDYLVQVGIKQAKFQYWLKQYREQHSTLDSFVEIQPSYSNPIIIRFPDGLEISLPEQTSVRIIKELINY